MKNDLLTKMLWRELEYYQTVPHAIPILIDGYLYFRNILNPADSMTLYRHPAEGVKDLGEVPIITDATEIIFSLNDIIKFYKNYALRDQRIKQFCEKITEMVKTGDHQSLFHSFQINKVDNEFGKVNLAVIVIDTEQTGSSFDIVVKDLDQDVLMPVLILNSDG